MNKAKGLYSSDYEHDSCGIGFVAQIKGKKSNDIVKRGIEILERMEHRGAESADNKTGDGSGILLQIPHDFYKSEISKLPDAGRYGTGIVFLPQNTSEAESCISVIDEICGNEGQEILAWRKIGVNNSMIGNIAKESEPAITQIFVTAKEEMSQDHLERKLYTVRKQCENIIRSSELKQRDMFYINSLSTKTIIYKGMLMPKQLKSYFNDLRDERVTSAIALVHSRFSTNTFPSWNLAQPFRMIAHNGEINTIKGNRFWMSARESLFRTDLFGEDIKKILPVIEPGKSDSASLDNALEMLTATGRSLAHAIMMLIPESWNEKNPIPDELKSFYEYHATFMEPWDGPASIVFSDGRYVGGTLDRNGLRPSRYVITKNDLIVMGSEAGVQTFDPEEIVSKGRLMPGKLLLIDTEQGRIIPDEEIKKTISGQKPYVDWINKNRINLSDIETKGIKSVEIAEENLHKLHLLYGYNREDIDDLLIPMAVNAQEPTASMGTDTPLAVFSDKPQLLFNYFKQMFAQVTNPAIDSIREELVMTLTSFIGSHKNLLDESSDHCRMIKFKRPVFTNTEFEKIKTINSPYFKSAVLDIVFPVENGVSGLENKLNELSGHAEKIIDEGYSLIILSDRIAGEKHVPIPSLLACSALHHHLIKVKKRTGVSLIIETAEPREVMHFCLLFGFGADAINPYGVFATINSLVQKGKIPNLTYEQAEENYLKGLDKAILKVLSKMGTSTLRSYRGAQIFEAIGLNSIFIDKYFTGTESRIDGVGIKEIANEAIIKHMNASQKKPAMLPSDGVYQYRKTGERHAWNPSTIPLLQWAVRTGNYEKFREFSLTVNEENRKPHVIRGLFDFVQKEPIPVDDVEPVDMLTKRLTTGAMSFGSLSIEAHEALAIAMNALGGRSNSGEGGEDPKRFDRRPDGTWTRSSIKQVASGRFGVTSNYLANADEIQIKIAQGAKPGEGGQLPGHKVDGIIATTRYSTPGVTLISPPPHHDIYSIEDLAQLIFDLKNANPMARISVKLVSEAGVGTVAAGVAKAHADNILISGYDGGTGASPQSSIKHAGLPWELGISETHQTLVMNNLRGRVRLQTDGQLKTGRDVVIAAMLGAEEFGFGTGVLIALGCIMMRKCHLNTCPVGVATQDPNLRNRFKGKPEHVINYFTFLAQEIREIMASLGIRKFNDLIGRTELLKVRKINHWKGKTVNPSRILYKPDTTGKAPLYCVESQIHKINKIIDRTIIDRMKTALGDKQKDENKSYNIYIEMPIHNTDRATGTMLSYEVSKMFGRRLPDDTINCTFRGTSGQSFGAFLTNGITFRLEGDSNDYFGKGLSGGRLIALPQTGSSFKPEENIIIGNTALYGATRGEAFICGMAGERFCVRNSGATAVVEGTGDHCAEYMTGGRIIVLGKIGRNFAAGMSGGIAYVLDYGNFDYFCNKGMVELSPVREYDDQDFIIEWLRKHVHYTNSSLAKEILKNWYDYLPRFIKVIPLEYKRALNEMKIALIDEKLKSIREEEQLEEAF